MSDVDIRRGYKVLTHDLRSPIQGGEPVCPDTFPARLPTVALDASDKECAAGWNYMASLVTAFQIVGLWPGGRPSRAFLVEASADAIERGDNRRASSLTLIREATGDEIREVIVTLSESSFGEHAVRMADEQLAWRTALARPHRSETAAVAAHLETALRARGLDWELREYKAARDAWDAWDAWTAWAARDAWTARDAWAARDARDAWTARDARDAWTAWAAWDARAAWDKRAAWTAWDAWAALTVCYASLRGWVEYPPERLTVGIREAYTNGLAIALPVSENVLGWSMDAAA